MNDDEIDIREVAYILWNYKILIIFVIVFSIFCSIYYLLNATYIYTAKTTFSILNSKDSLYNNLPNITKLSPYINIKGSDTLDIKALLYSKKFIEKIDQKENLRHDSFFYNDKKSKINFNFLSRKVTANLENHQNQNLQISNKFKNNVMLVLKNNRINELHVSHTDPDRSAKLANTILEELMNEFKRHAQEIEDTQITYFSQKIADTLADVDYAQKVLKDYTLNNKIISNELFQSQSLALNTKRKIYEQAQKTLDAVIDINDIVNKRKPTHDDFKEIQEKHPIINDINFRRLFNISKIINDWQWPSIQSLREVKETLNNRITRIISDIKRLEDEVIIFAEAAQELTTLERNVKVAEATYKIFIEFIRPQLLTEGYNPNPIKIYDYAIAPNTPSQPQNLKIIAYFISFGLIISIIIVVILSVKNKFLYSGYLTSEYFSQSQLIKLKNFKQFKKKIHTNKINKLSQIKNEALSFLLLDIQNSNKNIILLSELNTNFNLKTIGLWLAQYLAQQKDTIAYIDFSQTIQAPNSENNHFITAHEINNVTILNRNSNLTGLDILADKQTQIEIEHLAQENDYVIVTVSSEYTNLMIRNLENISPFCCLFIQIGKTNLNNIKSISKIKTPDIYLYE